jgi:hypothetical protein
VKSSEAVEKDDERSGALRSACEGSLSHPIDGWKWVSATSPEGQEIDGGGALVDRRGCCAAVAKRLERAGLPPPRANTQRSLRSLLGSALAPEVRTRATIAKRGAVSSATIAKRGAMQRDGVREVRIVQIRRGKMPEEQYRRSIISC